MFSDFCLDNWIFYSGFKSACTTVNGSLSIWSHCCITTCQWAQSDRWQSLVPEVVSSSLKWSKMNLVVNCLVLFVAKNSPDPTHRCTAAIIWLYFPSFFPLIKDTYASSHTHTDRGISNFMLIIHQFRELSLRCSTCGSCVFLCVCVCVCAFVMSVGKLNLEPIKGCYISRSSRASGPVEQCGGDKRPHSHGFYPLPPLLQGISDANLFFSIYLMEAEST